MVLYLCLCVCGDKGLNPMLVSMFLSMEMQCVDFHSLYFCISIFWRHTLQTFLSIQLTHSIRFHFKYSGARYGFRDANRSVYRQFKVIKLVDVSILNRLEINLETHAFAHIRLRIHAYTHIEFSLFSICVNLSSYV